MVTTTATTWACCQTGARVTAGHEDSISMGCLDGPGRRLLTVAFDKTARVWDIRSGRCLAVLQHSQQLIRGSMAPHGHTVVTVTADHVAHLWDVRSGQLLHSFEVGPLQMCCLQLAAYFAVCIACKLHQASAADHCPWGSCISLLSGALDKDMGHNVGCCRGIKRR